MDMQALMQMISQMMGNGGMGGGMDRGLGGGMDMRRPPMMDERRPPMMDNGMDMRRPPPLWDESGGMSKGLGGRMEQGGSMSSGLFGSGSGFNSSIAGPPTVQTIDNPGDGGDPVRGGFPGPSGGRWPIRIGTNLPPPSPFPNDPAPGLRQDRPGLMQRQRMGPVSLAQLAQLR